MGRPRLPRFIRFMPHVNLFKPAGIPARHLEQVGLTYEELEAVRLKDLEGLDQTQAAKKMKVSRPSYLRTLKSAREKIAESLINGKAIMIEGGNYTYPRGLRRGGFFAGGYRRGWGGSRRRFY